MHWQRLQLNLPQVPITDLRVTAGDLVAATQGRSFWILDDITPLRQLQAGIVDAGLHLFGPRPAYRIGSSRWPRKEGPNPPDGAVIRYSLARDLEDEAEPLRLEILDADGSVLRTFSSVPPAEQEKSLVKGVQTESAAPPLKTTRGMHQAVWNLRREPMNPVGDTIRYVSQVPPRLGPGTYTARLSLGDAHLEQSVVVVEDPRHEAAGAEAWATQQDVSNRLYELVNAIHDTTNRMRAVAEASKLLADESGDRAVEAASAALVERIAEWEVHSPQAPLPGGLRDEVSIPSLLLSVEVLHVLDAADQEPPVNAGILQQAAALEGRWQELMAEVGEIESQELAAMNSALQAAGVDKRVQL